MKTHELLIVTGPSYQEAVEQINLQAAGYDGIELRVDLLDFFCSTKINFLMRLNKKTTMITMRSEKQGGGYKGSLKNHISCMRALLKLKPEFVDIEQTLCPYIQNSRALLSYHNYKKGIENLDDLYHILKKETSGAIKLCLRAESKGQAKRYLNFLEKKRANGDLLTMLSPNKIGLATRRFGPRLGNQFNYTPCSSKNKRALNAIFT